MARKPLPTNMKRLRGEKRPCRLNPDEPVVECGEIVAPAVLSPVALKEWERIVPILKGMKILTPADVTSLGAYCQAYSHWVAAEELLKTQDLIIETKQDNVIQNPALGVANRAMDLMHKFLTEFGMTPSSRSKVTVTKTREKKTGFAALE